MTRWLWLLLAALLALAVLAGLAAGPIPLDPDDLLRALLRQARRILPRFPEPGAAAAVEAWCREELDRAERGREPYRWAFVSWRIDERG